MLERKDMANYDSYPVWKIDAGRLIQKFEPFTKDGRMIHKAMSTVGLCDCRLAHLSTCAVYLQALDAQSITVFTTII